MWRDDGAEKADWHGDFCPWLGTLSDRGLTGENHEVLGVRRGFGGVPVGGAMSTMGVGAVAVAGAGASTLVTGPVGSTRSARFFAGGATSAALDCCHSPHQLSARVSGKVDSTRDRTAGG